MHHNLYAVAFAIARQVAIGRGRDHEAALQRDDAPGTPVQSLGGAGDRPAEVQQARGESDGRA